MAAYSVLLGSSYSLGTVSDSENAGSESATTLRLLGISSGMNLWGQWIMEDASMENTSQLLHENGPGRCQNLKTQRPRAQTAPRLTVWRPTWNPQRCGSALAVADSESARSALATLLSEPRSAGA